MTRWLWFKCKVIGLHRMGAVSRDMWRAVATFRDAEGNITRVQEIEMRACMDCAQHEKGLLPRLGFAAK